MGSTRQAPIRRAQSSIPFIGPDMVAVPVQLRQSPKTPGIQFFLNNPSAQFRLSSRLSLARLAALSPSRPRALKRVPFDRKNKPNARSIQMYTKIAAMRVPRSSLGLRHSCVHVHLAGKASLPNATSGGFAAEAIFGAARFPVNRRSATGTIVANRPVLLKDPLIGFGERRSRPLEGHEIRESQGESCFQRCMGWQYANPGPHKK